MSVLEKGQAALAWTEAVGVWLLLAAALLLSLLLMGQCRGKRSAEDALAKQREAAAIEAAGLEQLHQVDRAELAAQLDRSRSESASFKAALADAQAKLRDAKVVGTLTASTGPRTVKPLDPKAPGCALAEGEQGDIKVRAATLATRDGNKVVVGTAEAYRASPRRFLFDGPFVASLTEAAELAPAPMRRSGWGAGPLAGISAAGGQLGVLVSTPEWRGQVSAVAGGLGGSGQFTLFVGALWRP